MADPVPSLDTLIIATCQAGQEIGVYLTENEARALLTAVLPRVVGAAVEALEPISTRITELEKGWPENFYSDEEYEDVKISDLRRARTVSDQLRALGGGSE